MYDVSHDNTVSKQDLTTLLNQIPKAVLGNYDYYSYDAQLPPHGHIPQSPMLDAPLSRQRSTSGSSIAMSEGAGGSTEDGHSSSLPPPLPGMHSRDPSGNVRGVAEQGAGSLGQGLGILERTESLGSSKDGGNAGLNAPLAPSSVVSSDLDYEDVDFYTNHDMVERAFAECDLNHDGRLSYEQFKMWVQRTPAILDYIESILPYNGPKDPHAHHHKKDTLPHLRRIQSRMSMGRGQVGVQEAAGEVFNHGPSTHSSLQKARANSLRMSLSGQNPRHSHSLQHLSITSMSSIGGSSVPHSPIMPGSTGGTGSRGPGQEHSGPPPGSLSRSSSFGFPTPVHASSSHGDRLALDSASKCCYSPCGASVCYTHPLFLSLSPCSTCRHARVPARRVQPGHGRGPQRDLPRRLGGAGRGLRARVRQRGAGPPAPDPRHGGHAERPPAAGHQRAARGDARRRRAGLRQARLH
jgi:hypothetical protein